MPLLALEGARSWAELVLAKHSKPEAETIRLHPDVLMPGMLASEMASMGFFASHKTLVIFDWAQVSTALQKELPTEDQIPDEILVVLRVDGGAAKKLPKGVHVTAQSASSPQSLLEGLIKVHQITVEDDIRQYLISVIEDQFDQVHELAEKAASSPDKTIDRNFLAAHSHFEVEANVFALMDGLIAGNVAAIDQQLEVLASAANDRLPQLLGGIAYAVRSWMDRKRAKPGTLRKIHTMLVEIDANSKSIPMRQDTMLRQFVLESFYLLHGRRLPSHLR